MRKKSSNGTGPSQATLATLKAESESNRASNFEGNGLRTVDSGSMDLFGDDDDDEEKLNKKRRMKELGADGDIDEMEYEADFADDEEKMEMDGDDEETKEMEVSIFLLLDFQRLSSSFPGTTEKGVSIRE